MKFKIVFIFFFCLSQFSLFSQNYLQTVKGKVVDAETGITIPGVAVRLKGDTTGKFVAVTDINGLFKILQVPIGRHRFEFNLMGYKPLVTPDIIVVSAKTTDLNIVLEESINQLNEIEVNADNLNPLD